jgi:small-conductance mechanosensitive channel
VVEIGLRATHLRTVDGVQLVIPNHLLVTKEVLNHSYPLRRARIVVEVPVSLSEDVDAVGGILDRIAGAHAEVLAEPPPSVRLEAILESHFKFVLIAWVDEPTKTVRIASQLRVAVAQAFAEHGIQFIPPELLAQLRVRREVPAERKEAH